MKGDFSRGTMPDKPRKKSGLFWTVLIVIVVILVVIFFVSSNNTKPQDEILLDETVQEDSPITPEFTDNNDSDPGVTDSTDDGDTSVESVVPELSGIVVLAYTDSGFAEKTITIKSGTTVEFKNQSSRGMWPASAMHPTHTVYPDSDIKKCGTAEEEGIFDSCGEIAPRESWSFTFNEVGEWGYHNHNNPSHFGKIIVQ